MGWFRMGWFSRRSKFPDPVPPATGNRWGQLLEAQCPELAEPIPVPGGADTAVAGGGRPPAVEPRTKRVSMSLTEAEYAVWVAAAEGARLSVWAREQVQHQLATEWPGAGQVQELGRLRADLARVGSNLNQLMRAVNQGQVPSIQELIDAVNLLTAELGEVRRQLP